MIHQGKIGIVATLRAMLRHKPFSWLAAVPSVIATDSMVMETALPAKVYPSMGSTVVTDRAVIDRFEGRSAVLLVGDEGRPVDVFRRQLPRTAREGQWLRITLRDGEIVQAVVDEAATEEARRRIQEKLERLRRGEHLV